MEHQDWNSIIIKAKHKGYISNINTLLMGNALVVGVVDRIGLELAKQITI